MKNKQKQASLWLQVTLMVSLMGLIVLLVSHSSKPSHALAARGLSWPELQLQEIVSDLSISLQVTHAGDGSGRLFIVEKGGYVHVYKNRTVLSPPFLDISGLVSSDSEQGLLGLAFSPNYIYNGNFYVNYTDLAGNTQVVRYHVSDNPDVADPNSAEIVISIVQDSSSHNGGQIAFGPDGYFYIGIGDGGLRGEPKNRAQDTAQLLGKILRIDVETGDPATYTIPPDNPFVGDPATRDEIWTFGFRNPWRFSFDRLTGDLYIGDVGDKMWEEVDFQPASSSGGENYGWRCYEGTHDYNTSGCGSTEQYTFPILEYGRKDGGGCAVTGGFVYRGHTYPRMQGIYFYADYCSGRIWGLQHDGTSWQNAELLRVDNRFSSFGEDELGNLYLVSLSGIFQLVDPNGPTPTPTPTVVLKEALYLPILLR